jgi:hypothetical protein
MKILREKEDSTICVSDKVTYDGEFLEVIKSNDRERAVKLFTAINYKNRLVSYSLVTKTSIFHQAVN